MSLRLLLPSYGQFQSGASIFKSVACSTHTQITILKVTAISLVEFSLVFATVFIDRGFYGKGV